MKKDLNLPKTDFPQKANSKLREPGFNKLWEENNVFKTKSDSNLKGDFLLHDGPPYANGNLHMGHVLNKVLKDVVNKWKLMDGYKVYFRPGWDCHGLPTELKVQKEYGSKLSTKELRSKCRDHANKYVSLQKESFKKLGVSADWDNPYLTMDTDYELSQLKSVGDLLLKGLLYRDEKPVYYSPSTQTVLAEAELEYKDREDTSVYFKFKSSDFSFLVWTTMPWTLPGNKAVCLNSKMEYSLVEMDGERLLLSSNRLQVLQSEFKVVDKFMGSDLEGTEYYNPLTKETNKVVTDRFVTDESGTGCVHLCPAHGDDDFKVCNEYNLTPLLLTDKNGCYLSNGLYVLNEGTQWVLKEMGSHDMTLYTEKFTHSYPHDWRSGEPVLFMLTKQFFMKLDKGLLMEKTKDVDFSKNSYKNRFKNMLHNRGNWCVSRQRKWGFPLTVFFNENKEVVFNKEMLDHLVKLFEKYGSDCWFDMKTDDLLPDNYKGKNFKKCEDTLDVWLDSGFSWNNVLKGKKADLYFEGSDQHRGWFQSSFTTSVMLNGQSPFKKLLTHGFVMDEHGKKMSKSLGNVVDPNKYLELYNADVVRLWTVSVDYTSDVRVSDSSMETSSKVYFKLRNSFRYMLSNLFDYDTNYVPNNLCDKDLLALKNLDKYENQMKEAYDKYDFRKLYNLTTSFVSNTSKKYFDLETKELLYEGKNDGEERRNRQYVMDKYLNSLVKLLSPMTPYLCEDVWSYMDKKELSVFLSDK